ncbi:MAG TPA: acyltransferase domain-containing protein, partial [Thermoanaerobaculia bacterium]
MDPRRDPIAVVGLACRLPGAPDADSFWRLLEEGRSAVGLVPPERWSAQAFPEARWGAFVENVADFDPGFFRISPREASAMDPQQRMLLELSWEAIEDAGLTPEKLLPEKLTGRNASVFIGAIAGDYALLTARSEAMERHTFTGLQRGLIANRVSHLFDLRGPSLTVDTGQSSSLVAVHMACESLRSGESTLAIAGGVHLNLAVDPALTAANFGVLSPDGRCFTFDARANGFVRGEGGAVIVLKLLSQALADGDDIRCLILGSAINSDGEGEGLTVPNGHAHQELLRRACARAAVEPAGVHYVELHGTGTPVGDPIEAAALGAVFGPDRQAPLRVGSVKTNIGHLEGAAGIAGFVKTALSIERGIVPPSLNFERPGVPLDALNLRVQQSCEAWPDGARIAGVSSFGVGGTNCHVLLSSWDAPRVAAESAAESAGESSAALPWIVSGHTDAALRANAARLRAVSAAPNDVARALIDRATFEHRAVILAPDVDALGALANNDALGALATGAAHANVIEGTALPQTRNVFVFPGQGSQWPEMAARLLETSDVFRASIEACHEALAPFTDWRLMDVLRGVPGAPPLERVDVVQPALFAMMVSLAALWRSHGVEPDAVVGHSQGEIAAACVAGALTLSDAARVVALRSRAISRIAGRGAMASVLAPAARVECHLQPGRAWIAAVNGPMSTVVSGDPEALDALIAACEREEIRVRRIPVDYASHSPHVEVLRDELHALLADICPRPAQIAFYSSVTAGRIDGGQLDAGYWYRNLLSRVRFEETMRALTDDGHRLFIEASPHPVLLGGIEETLESHGLDHEAAAIGSLQRDHGDFDRALAEAHVRGARVVWPRTNGPRTKLPSYAFQRQRCWLGEEAVLASVEETRDLLEIVRAQVAIVLGHASANDVSPTRTFKSLGVDSLGAVQVRNRLKRVTGLRIHTTILFDHPTPAALARFLEEQAGGRVWCGLPAHP